MSGAIYVTNSKNGKISGIKKCDATYASISATCPNSCKLKGDGCYGELSYVGIVNARLNKKADKMSAIQVARAEAQAIDNSYDGKKVPGRDLRLHVSGDSRTITGTKIINAAVGRWKRRGGDTAFSYTHAWKNVHRSHWSNVSVLASIDSIEQVAGAKLQGYAPAIVVSKYPSKRAFTLPDSDIKWIPCPAELKENISCTSCRLCMKADWLYSTNRGIAFAAHGVRKENIKKRLPLIK